MLQESSMKEVGKDLSMKEETKVELKPAKKEKRRDQIIFTTKNLNEFGVEFCRQLILFMNPVIYRRYLNILNQKARKKR
jgi:hypothetical protein